jgi:hypothetical protein
MSLKSKKSWKIKLKTKKIKNIQSIEIKLNVGIKKKKKREPTPFFVNMNNEVAGFPLVLLVFS